jgi:hypothetical protein
MADDGMLLGLAVVGIGGYLLWQSGLLGGGVSQATGVPVPVTQQTGNFQESQLVTQTPGIGSIVITPDIILQARADMLMAIPHCSFDDFRERDDDEGHNCDASIKIWEQEHNHMFNTIKERNQHSLMRCNIISFYHDIDFRRDFDDPIRQHICLNKRVIVNEDRLGRRDSPRANSAALDVAHVTAPVIQNCNKCTVNVGAVSNVPAINITNAPVINNTNTNVNTPTAVAKAVNKAPAPGANTPPIPVNTPAPPPHSPASASTTPTTPTAGCVGTGGKCAGGTRPATAGGAPPRIPKVPPATATAAYGWAYAGYRY